MLIKLDFSLSVMYSKLICIINTGGYVASYLIIEKRLSFPDDSNNKCSSESGHISLPAINNLTLQGNPLSALEQTSRHIVLKMWVIFFTRMLF